MISFKKHVKSNDIFNTCKLSYGREKSEGFTKRAYLYDIEHHAFQEVIIIVPLEMNYGSLGGCAISAGSPASLSPYPTASESILTSFSDKGLIFLH